MSPQQSRGASGGVKAGSTPGQSEETPQKPSRRRECGYRECEETFKPSVPSQKYHSDSCRKREYECRKRDDVAERVAHEVALRIAGHLDEWVQEALEGVER